MTFAMNIGLSALQANQQALQTVAHNLSNAGTPGYHRRTANFVERFPVPSGNLLLGAGVDVTSITRARSFLIEQSLTANITTKSENAAQLETLQRLEALYTPGDGGLQQRLQTFFDRMFAVTSGPDSNILRQQAISAAHDLTEEINATASSIHQLQQSLNSELETTVDNVNKLAERIVALNREIGIAEGRGLQPHDLRDQRDQLLNDLAGLVDIRTWEWAGQPDVAAFGNGGITLSTQPVSVSLRLVDGKATVWSDQSGRELNFGGGRLAGLLEARNEIVPAALDRLQTFTDTFIQQVDQIQATGLGKAGPFTWLESTRPVDDVNATLVTAGVRFPVQAGQLFVTVTDKATGERRLTAIDIDPNTDSLSDVIAAIDAIDHLQAFVDPQTGKFSIESESGYAFDFVGRLETTPDTSAVTGTSTIEIGGKYTASVNDELQFTVVGSGDVGAASGLQVEVRNSIGALVKTLDIGLGYEPGAALDVIDGVKVSFGPGSLNAGDTFTTPVVADSDTAGFLPAVGLNSFFDGTQIGLLSVSDDLRADPELLSASYTGLPADGLNAARFAALRDELLLGDGHLTLEDYLAETAALTGIDVQNLTTSQTHLDSLGAQLEADRETVSGVDPNEEFVKMLNFQRGFQAAAKLIASVNDTLDELFAIVP